VRVSADVQAGQKTGAFLDQRENHQLAASYARGEALDCFSYLGGFALQLATRASRVTAVEISEQACEALRRNVERNGFRNVEVVAANAFDFPPGRGGRGAPLRHHRARPALVREEQGRDRVRGARVQGDQPAGAPAARPRRDPHDRELHLPRGRGALRGDAGLRGRRTHGVACRSSSAGARLATTRC
jgi:hypothetical protein